MVNNRRIQRAPTIPMASNDDDAADRFRVQYERTGELVGGMAEAFQDLWAYAENRAAIKAADGTVYGVSEITEAVRDPLGHIRLTFTLLSEDEADSASFEQLAGPVGTPITRSRALGSITLRYDQITAVLLDEDEPDE